MTNQETKLVEAFRDVLMTIKSAHDSYTSYGIMKKAMFGLDEIERYEAALASYDAAQSSGQTIPAREVCDSYHSILLGGKCQNCGHHFDDHSRPMLHPEQANAGFHSAGMRGAAKEAAREVEQLKDIYRRNRGSNGREYSKEQANAAESVTVPIGFLSCLEGVLEEVSKHMPISRYGNNFEDDLRLCLGQVRAALTVKGEKK